MGTAKISTAVNGSTRIITLKGVLFVPGICANLISVAKATDLGFCAEFSLKQCIFKKGNKVLACATKDNGVYVLDEGRHISPETALAIGDTDDPTQAKQYTELWHRRLGHLNIRYVKALADGAGEGITFREGPG